LILLTLYNTLSLAYPLSIKIIKDDLKEYILLYAKTEP